MKNAVSLQPPAHAGPSLSDLSALKMEAIRSSEMSVHTKSTQRYIPEDGILCCYLFSFVQYSVFSIDKYLHVILIDLGLVEF
jgi:hypothetical protein